MVAKRDPTQASKAEHDPGEGWTLLHLDVNQCGGEQHAREVVKFFNDLMGTIPPRWDGRTQKYLPGQVTIGKAFVDQWAVPPGWHPNKHVLAIDQTASDFRKVVWDMTVGTNPDMPEAIYPVLFTRVALEWLTIECEGFVPIELRGAIVEAICRQFKKVEPRDEAVASVVIAECLLAAAFTLRFSSLCRKVKGGVGDALKKALNLQGGDE